MDLNDVVALASGMGVGAASRWAYVRHRRNKAKGRPDYARIEALEKELGLGVHAPGRAQQIHLKLDELYVLYEACPSEEILRHIRLLVAEYQRALEAEHGSTHE
jgi:hypothetical protein